MDRIQTPFDSVQKTPSYRSVTYKTKVGSLGKGKLLKKLAEKEKNSEELNNLYLESSHKKNRLEEKNTFERKHILPSSKVVNIRNKRQQYKANTASEIFVYEGSLFSHLAKGKFSKMVYSRTFECLKIIYSSRREDNEFCRPAVLDLCEENKICRLSEIMQQRYAVAKMLLNKTIQKRDFRKECVKSMTEMIYIMLEEESVDRTLENFNFNTAYQATTLFKQVVYALAVAEENCEFEHRNLVRENIGIKLTNCKTFCYSLHSHQYEVRTAGLEVVIMDFNCSRMTYGHWSSQAIVYRNLDNFVNQVSKETDGRKDVYCNMKNYVGADWKYFFPYTNILWLEYLLDILLRADYLCPEFSENLRSLFYMQRIRNTIRSFTSASDLVISSDIFSNFP